MGVWGAGVSSSDDFQDVKELFFDYFYHSKMSVEEIENTVLGNYGESIADENSGEWHDVYFALAYCEWKCGALSERVKAKVNDIAQSGSNLVYIKELQASELVLKKREREIDKFVAKIISENPKPLKRRYKKPFEFPLKSGDVFACYSKKNGCYGCGIALDVRESQLKPWEEAYHFSALLLIADCRPKELPSVGDVLDANALDIFWNGGCVYNLPERGIKILGNVANQIDSDYSEYFGSYKESGRIFRIGEYLHPTFDELISPDYKSLVGGFACGKSVRFFFRKRNLRTTKEIYGIGGR